MKIPEILLWGLLATGLLTTLLRASQALRLTRMDVPFLLGTIVTPDRDRAKVIGFCWREPPSTGSHTEKRLRRIVKQICEHQLETTLAVSRRT